MQQIRIVRDTHADEKGNKKKKPHRGYAFIVFEREKDMRGNTAIDIPKPTTLEPAGEPMPHRDHGPQACLPRFPLLPFIYVITKVCR